MAPCTECHVPCSCYDPTMADEVTTHAGDHAAPGVVQKLGQLFHSVGFSNTLFVSGGLDLMHLFHDFGGGNFGESFGKQVVTGVTVGHALDLSGVGLVGNVLQKDDMHDRYLSNVRIDADIILN